MTSVSPAGPERRRPLPRYHQVEEWVRGQIASGAWAPGSLIPSEPELCRRFGVSRITIRKAMGNLVQDGQVRVVQGRGTFVAAPKMAERFIQRAFGIYEDFERRGISLTTRVLRQEVAAASGEIADRLRLEVGEQVHVIERLRSVGDEKMLISITYIPYQLCPELAHEDLTLGSLYRLLRTRYGLAITRGERRLEAVAAGQHEARLLDVALATPLLQLDSVAYRRDGRPFEYSITLHRGDKAAVEVEFFGSEEDMLAGLEAVVDLRAARGGDQLTAGESGGAGHVH